MERMLIKLQQDIRPILSKKMVVAYDGHKSGITY